jgi:hypothetical protein
VAPWVIDVWVAVVVLVLATAAWCSWTATRLDRLHLRCEAAEAAVRTHLLRRSGAALELAAGGLSDPASALLLLDAASAAREAESSPSSEDGGWLAESDLTSALHAVELPAADVEPVVEQLHDAAARASMARRIHNDLVATTLALRERRRVRWFRLAGHAPPPAMIDFDDGVP